MSVTTGAITGTLHKSSDDLYTLFLDVTSPDWTQYQSVSVRAGEQEFTPADDTTVGYIMNSDITSLTVTATNGTQTITDTYDLSDIVYDPTPAPAPAITAPSLAVPASDSQAGGATVSDWQSDMVIDTDAHTITATLHEHEGTYGYAVDVKSNDWTQYIEVMIDDGSAEQEEDIIRVDSDTSVFFSIADRNNPPTELRLEWWYMEDGEETAGSDTYTLTFNFE